LALTLDVDLTTINAYHESGHAVMAIVLGGCVERITIEPHFDDGPLRYGETITSWPWLAQDATPSKHRISAEIAVSLAGPVAEMIYLNERFSIEAIEEWSLDCRTANQLASQVASSPVSKNELLRESESIVRERLNEPQTWSAVAALSDELLAHETLEKDQIHDVTFFWLQR